MIENAQRGPSPQGAQLAEPEEPEERVMLIGGSELGALLGVSRQRVSQIVRGRSRVEFPEPIAVLGARRLWELDDVLQWIVASGRAQAVLEHHGYARRSS